MKYKFKIEYMKKNNYFLDRLDKIWNNLDLESHQGFTCKYLDDLIKHFENLDDQITFDEVEFKLSEIKGIISIINPTFKIDVKIFQKLLKELDYWKQNIDELQRIYQQS